MVDFDIHLYPDSFVFLSDLSLIIALPCKVTPTVPLLNFVVTWISLSVVECICQN